MTTLRAELDSRREEFDSHFALARALERRMMFDDDSSLGELSLSARHINTLKSGLIIHIYNIEESIMSQALDFVGRALVGADPRRLTEHSLREWLRASVIARIDENDEVEMVNEDGRLDKIYRASVLLLQPTLGGRASLKKPSGTWHDKNIDMFLRRIKASFSMPPDMWLKIAKSAQYGDKTPLQFIADKRNSIAHGRRSFEGGASELSLDAIRELADVTLDYMGFVVDSIYNHIEANAHLAAGSEI